MTETAERSIESIIREARELLEPSPVRTYRVPRWLAAKLRRAVKQGLIELEFDVQDPIWLLQKAVSEAVRRAGQTSEHWHDHSGTTRVGGKEYFVSEPYGFTSDSIPALNAFAELLNLEWGIEANSWHYPGHTVRIWFCPRRMRRFPPTPNT